ncbi:tRNA (guanosine(18)-2'-O)-methyltransferase [[Candida] anglica]|uniref:tRNA (Guanosine(18)-2'-O)-methyltransferase n=1 Tax=[Candida] anglica TaxID=148631 RepID=A0ABP0ELE8_9ASCO
MKPSLADNYCPDPQMSSISLVAKYLDDTRKAELATSLVSEIDSSQESLSVLCDLLDSLDITTKSSIYPQILDFCTSILDDPSKNDYAAVTKLASGLPALRKDLVNRATTHLSLYLHQSKVNLLPEFKQLVKGTEVSDQDQQLTNEHIVSVFEFLEYMFMHSVLVEADDVTELDNLLCLLIGVNDEAVSSAVSSMLRWRIHSIANSTNMVTSIWTIIFALEKSSAKHHKAHSYVLWLRYLTSFSAEELAADPAFQSQVSSEHYWNCVQIGLTSPFHEHRKFSLSILQVSVKGIANSFTNSFMSWDTTKAHVYLKEWARYVTLFEILGIDTSLHQAEAGTRDIIGLISPNSVIHPSWGFCLLSTGFNASMDSVRKFALSLLMSIPPQNLYLIKHGLPFLEGVFLPYAMLAAHFHVRKVGCTNENNCEYGERITAFVCSLVENLETEQEFQDTTTAIFTALNTADVFDPAKIYVSLGLLKGLNSKRVLKYGTRLESLLLSMIEYKPEGFLFQRSLQTINLRLLLNFKFVDVSTFFGSIDKFYKFNGCEIIGDHVDLISEYLSKHSVSLADLQSVNSSGELEALVFAVIQRIYPESNVSIDGDSLIVNVLEQGIVKDIDAKIVQQFVSNVLTSKVVDEEQLQLYTRLSNVEENVWLTYQDQISENLPTFWEIIQSDVKSSDELCLRISAKKLSFFSILCRAIPGQDNMFDLKSLINFSSILFSNSRDASKSSKTFYKVRDEAFGHLYTLLDVSIGTLESLTGSQIKDIISIIDCNSSGVEHNTALVTLVQRLITEAESPETIQSIVEHLDELWSSLTSARLQLNQKDLHVAVIQALSHKKILSQSVSNPAISEILLAFSITVIQNSHGRRCLLPALTKSLSDFQIAHHPDEFESCPWIPEVLVRGYTVLQLKSNVFRLENIIGKLYDTKIARTTNSDIYREIYGLEDISSRVNIMAILGSTKSSHFSKRILDFIVTNEREFFLFEVVKRTDGLEEWTRIQLFSVILIASRNIASHYMIQNYMTRFVGLLETDPSPLVRIYIEWMIATYLLDSPEDTEKIFLTLKKLVDMNGGKPTLLTSYERILLIMIQQLPKEKEEELLTKLLTVVLPAATSNKAITRHFSLSLTCAIYPEIKSKKLDIDPQLLAVVENMYNTAILSDAFGTHRSGDATLWDITKDMTLVSISGGVLLRVSDRDIDFITKESYLACLSESQLNALQVPVGENFEELWIKDRKLQGDKRAIASRDTASASSIDQSPLQTKSGALNSILDVDEDTRHVVRSDLIVVSSLVNKPPNLGGICRLCDVLGAGTLTLHDLNVKNHPQFKTVAVTADRWMPMIEVKPEDIISYFAEKKREGYTLIGLEQTDKSVELNHELKFPKKSLILIGREKEGIPGDLLAELDFCVEIKQVGVIRSMNIQTATAIIVHAYSTQHC